MAESYEVPKREKKLSECPSYPEESWRRTRPEELFLLKEDLIFFNGKAYSDGNLSMLMPWKAYVKKVPIEELSRDLEKLKDDIFDEISLEFLKNELQRLIIIDIHNGTANIKIASTLSSNLDVLSLPTTQDAIDSKSAISQALANRLSVICPQTLRLKIESRKNETPLLLSLVSLKSSLSQNYTSLHYELSKSSNCDLIHVDIAKDFCHSKHLVTLEPHARLNKLWLNLSKPSEGDGYKIFDRKVELHDNAKFYDAQFFSHSSSNIRVNSNVVFKGEKSNAQCGAIVLNNNAHFDYEPIQEHLASKSTSLLKINMLLRKRAHSIFQGLVRIHKLAQKCHGEQTNKNILLNSKARVDSIPRLEISPNDVFCKHGSATSELDKKQLYYLHTRGFNKDESKKLLMSSFLNETLFPLEDNILLQSLLESLSRKYLNDFLQEG